MRLKLLFEGAVLGVALGAVAAHLCCWVSSFVIWEVTGVSILGTCRTKTRTD